MLSIIRKQVSRSDRVGHQMTAGQIIDRALFPIFRVFNRGPRVFMFHSVGESTVTLCTGESAPQISPTVFQAFLEWLDEHTKIVTVSELCEIRSRRRPLHDQITAVSLDDGYEDNYSVAYPLFRRLGIPGTVYLTTGMIREGPQTPGDGLLALQIKEMADNGIEFGAHTLTHPRLSQIPLDKARTEIMHSREIVQDITGLPCDGFCYPYGSYTLGVHELVARGGFRYAVTTEDRLFGGGDSFRVQRTVLPANPTSTDFAIRLSGAHAWRQSIFQVARRTRRIAKTTGPQKYAGV